MKIVVSDTNPIFKYIIESDDIESLKIELSEDWEKDEEERVFVTIVLKNRTEYVVNESFYHICRAIDANILDPSTCTIEYLKNKDEKIEERRLSLWSNNEEDECEEEITQEN